MAIVRVVRLHVAWQGAHRERDDDMKILIASDIHGSALWCERLMEQVECEAPDKIILLGDLLYHGPRNPLPEGHDPREVARMLNECADRIIAVRGNCEAEVDQVMLDFPCMADYAVVVDGEHELFCTHGHLFDAENLPPLPPDAHFVSGHTHVQVNDVVEGRRFVNPGSVSLPKDGIHGYAIYQDGVFELRSL